MYEIDGVVIKVNDFSLYKKLGFTAHHPRWAMAFKFEARQGTTKLTDVHFTGELKKYGRDEARSIVEHLGGRTVGNISSKVNYLVTGKDPGSKLEQARKKDTLKIIGEKKFLQLIGKKQYA